MSLPLIDHRYKLPADLTAVLDAIAEARGVEKSLIAREFIERELTKELNKFRLILSELKQVGMLSLIEDSQGVGGRK
jgi:predicted DNA-binding protein